MASRVCAIVVSWNTRDLLRECLTALTAQDTADSVRPSASTTARPMAAWTWSRAVAVRRPSFPNQENVGFARLATRASRWAMENTGQNNIALVNSDVVVRRRRSAPWFAQMADRPEVAVVGPRAAPADGRLQTGAAGFAPTAWSGVCYLPSFCPRSRRSGARGFIIDQRYFSPAARSRAVDWVSGACLVARAAAIRAGRLLRQPLSHVRRRRRVCQRMRRASFSVWYVPQVEVVHRHGGSASHASPQWLASACELVRASAGSSEYLAFRMAAALGLTARASSMPSRTLPRERKR